MRSLLLSKKYVGASPQSTDFYVLPRPVPTQRIQIPFSQIMGSVLSRKKVYDDPFEFAGLREYTKSDPMKYINWKATAKTGNMLVNIHESTLSQKVAVLLDMVHRGWNVLSAPDFTGMYYDAVSAVPVINLSTPPSVPWRCGAIYTTPAAWG